MALFVHQFLAGEPGFGLKLDGVMDESDISVFSGCIEQEDNKICTSACSVFAAAASSKAPRGDATFVLGYLWFVKYSLSHWMGAFLRRLW